MNTINTNNRIIWIILFLFIASLLLYANRCVILSDNYEVGDYAANSLLIIDAKSFNLWVGHYSRLGFNQPGPAILYVLAIGEWLFHDLTGLVKSPFSGQLIAVAFYNAFWISLLGSLFLRMYSSIVAVILSIATFLFTMALFDHVSLIGIWPPHLFLCPFAVTILALARLSASKTDGMIPLALSSGFLINGYASFVPILGIMLTGIIVYNFFNNKSYPEQRIIATQFLLKNNRIILLSIGTFIVFFIPLLIMTIKEFPGPIANYIKYGGGHKPNTIKQALEFMSVYWDGYAPMFIGMLACLLLPLHKINNQNSSIKGIVVAIFSATIALFFYAIYGVDSIKLWHVGLFYHAVPALLAATIAAVILIVSASRFSKIVAIVLSIIMLIVFFYQIKPIKYNSNDVVGIYNVLQKQKTNGRLVLDLNNTKEDWGYIWSTILSVQIYAKRAGNDLLCINKNWRIVFTKQAQCSQQELSSGKHFIVKRSLIKLKPKQGFQVAGLAFISQ